jgi:Ca-activated chloride channel homolog
VEAVDALLAFIRGTLFEWRGTSIADLSFRHRDTARLILIVLGSSALALLAVHTAARSVRRARRVTVPAILPGLRQSPLLWIRHGPLCLLLLGLPFLLLALADPYTTLARKDISFPGRRIGLLIDASASMNEPFKAERLNAKGSEQAAFFTTVAAAEYFIRLRMKGKYRDLMSLIEFGDEAYVVTPFTNDYENILLSTSLIGDLTEWDNFPDKGTTIGRAIEQSVELFKAFDFLDASGNLMVIISDGRDSEVSIGGRSIYDIMQGSLDAKVPVYFIRVGYNRQMGGNIPDELWKVAVERTGGRFYAAADESTILQAVQEIDKVSVGTISVKQYGTERARFEPYALIGAGLWSIALLLKLAVPYFQTFP